MRRESASLLNRAVFWSPVAHILSVLASARRTIHGELQLVATNKARPEDRRLLVEMSGLIGQQGAVTVNFTKVASFKS